MGLAWLMSGSGSAQTFSAASIRPSAAQVQFEHDGKTETTPGTVSIRDVTVATCIKWAYGVQDSQISGLEWLQSEHFDILAKADEPVADPQLKLMVRAVLTERYVLSVAKSGHKLHESTIDEKPFRQNSAIGTVVKAMTMKEFADFMADALQTPIADMTGMTGRYDFELDFTPYLPPGGRVMKMEFDNSTGIIISAIKGELGFDVESRKEKIEMLVIDHVERPSHN